MLMESQVLVKIYFDSVIKHTQHVQEYRQLSLRLFDRINGVKLPLFIHSSHLYSSLSSILILFIFFLSIIDYNAQRLERVRKRNKTKHYDRSFCVTTSIKMLKLVVSCSHSSRVHEISAFYFYLTCYRVTL